MNSLPPPGDAALLCHVCASPDLELLAEYGAFRRVTSDCKPWPAGGRLGACRACGCIQKVIDQAWRAEIQEIYGAYTIYSQSGGVEQAVFSPGSGAAAPRSHGLLARLRTGTFLPRHGRLLDVGCGNGAFLRAFSALIPGWSFMGTELSDQYRSVVEGIAGVEALHTGPLEQVPGRFDLVVLMHALEHIPAPVEILAGLAGKLHPTGLLLVEVPDHLQNPFDLLIADHSTHFTAATLRAVIARAGYRADLIATDWMPKELTALARPGAGHAAGAPPAAPPAGTSAARSLAWLRSVITVARAVARSGSFGLFGSSIAATWLDSELGEAVGFFVDEDPSRQGRTHLGRPIYHPSEVPEKSQVFIALPAPLALAVKLRMEKDYPTGCYHLPPPFADGADRTG
jgi:2-polyprenyl-3-methyl-5-hydroxy-6-metoxy-1,4-benzoquinol methylase